MMGAIDAIRERRASGFYNPEKAILGPRIMPAGYVNGIKKQAKEDIDWLLKRVAELEGLLLKNLCPDHLEAIGQRETGERLSGFREERTVNIAACAFAWRKCSECGGEGARCSPEENLGPTPGGGSLIRTIGVECPTCKGTGKRFALDPDGTIGLREDCRINPRLDVDCQGRGSVPTTDAWVWLEAADDATQNLLRAKLPGVAWRNNMERAAVRGDKESFFKALAECLVAQGYTLGGE